VLTSRGEGIPPTWSTVDPSKAITNLNMSNFSIFNVPNINATGALSVGTNASTTSVILGRTGIFTNINGSLQINGSSGIANQVLTSRGEGIPPTWSTVDPSKAITNLNMSNFSIFNVPNIDATGALSVGTNASTTSITLGRTGIFTNINGSLQINGSSGINNQVLTSGGLGIPPTWKTPSFISTATANLNMNGYTITNVASINSILSHFTLASSAASITIGKTGIFTNINGSLQINGSSGIANQVLTSGGLGIPPTWSTTSFVSTATTDLNMSNFSITNVSSINASGTLSVGTNASTTSIIVGRTGIFTNINGSLQINGSSGIANQVLTSGGLGIPPTWTTLPANSFISTATTDLNMNNFSIRNVSSINASGILSIGTNVSTTSLILGRTGIFTNINGSLQINGSSGIVNQVLTSGGAGIPPTWTTIPSSTFISTATTNLNMNNFSITNVSSIDASGVLSIGTNVSTTSVTIGRLSSSGTNINIYGKILTCTPANYININTPALYVANTPIDAGSVVSTGILKIGTKETTSNISIGRTGITTTINGSLQINGSSGIANQVLTSGGEGIPPTWTTIPSSTFISTATTNLNMNNFSITNVSNIDASGSLRIGTNASTTNVSIGRTGISTSINGSLQINGSSGSLNQVLTSGGEGIPPIWTTIPSSSFISTATTDLNMNNLSIVNLTNITNSNSNFKVIASSITLGSSASAPNMFLFSRYLQLTTSTDISISALTIKFNGAKLEGGNATLSVGTNETTPSIILGRTGIFTNINGSLQINGSSGIANQVLTSRGSGIPPTWANPSFVSNATTDLNMSNFSITNVSTIDASGTLSIGTNASTTSIIVGRTGIFTNINGSLQINGSSGSLNQVLTSGGEGIPPTWTTIPARSFISTATTNLNMNNFSITNVLSINANGELSIGTNASTTSLKIGRLAGSSGPDITITGKNVIFTPHSGITINTFALYVANTPIDAGSVVSTGILQIGTKETTSNISIGRTGIITSINGSLQINGSSGSLNQVLTSGGADIPPTWTTIPSSTFISTATTNLNMNNFSITNVSSINASGELSIGTNASTTAIRMGFSGKTTHIAGTTSCFLLSSNAISANNIESNKILPFGNSALEIAAGTSRTGSINIQSESLLKNEIHIGSAPSIININGSVINLNGSVINLNGSVRVPTIDGINTLLRVGTNASTTNISIGRTGIITTINGSLQINGSSGIANQVLTSGGEGIPPTWTNPSFVSTATTDLNMNNFSITNVENIDSNGVLNIGRTATTNTIYIGNTLSSGISTNIEGRDMVRISSTRIIELNADSGVYLTSGELDGGNGLVFANKLNIGCKLLTTNISIGRTGIITNINGSLQINGSSGTVNQVLTSGGAGIPPTWTNPSFVSTATTNLNMNNFSITNVSNIDASGTLSVGTNASTTNISIGRTGISTSINGTLQINGALQLNGSSGSVNQVLTSLGQIYAPVWKNPSFVSTATTNLNMNNLLIYDVEKIYGTGGLDIGTNASTTSMILGRTGITTNINGSLQINGASGSVNQVLTSNGTLATWGKRIECGVTNATTIGTQAFSPVFTTKPVVVITPLASSSSVNAVVTIISDSSFSWNCNSPVAIQWIAIG
jgi:hypothetical protein